MEEVGSGWRQCRGHCSVTNSRGSPLRHVSHVFVTLSGSILLTFLRNLCAPSSMSIQLSVNTPVLVSQTLMLPQSADSGNPSTTEPPGGVGVLSPLHLHNSGEASEGLPAVPRNTYTVFCQIQRGSVTMCLSPSSVVPIPVYWAASRVAPVKDDDGESFIKS